MSALEQALARAYRGGRLQFDSPRQESPPLPAPVAAEVVPLVPETAGAAEPQPVPPSPRLSVYRDEGGVEDVPTPASRGANVVASAFAPEAFRPLLEVDRFSWPSICESLLFQAAAAFDRLTSELTMCAHSGRKRVGLASCTAGQGCTTAVLCTARQLAAQGLRCVLVDANLRNATLARQLGVAVQSGWEDVLGGEVTLGEVVVTSLEDALALVPRRLPELPGRRPESTLRAAVTFELLSEYYDLVLVDAGPASGDERLADLAACAALLRLDVVYLVCDVRQEPADRQRAAEALAKHALDVRGVVENFSVSRTRRPRLSLLRTQD